VLVAFIQVVYPLVDCARTVRSGLVTFLIDRSIKIEFPVARFEPIEASLPTGLSYKWL